MSYVLTYDTLVAQTSNWLERQGDTQLVAEIPFLISLAENRISDEIKCLATQKSVTGDLVPGGYALAKPVRWRESISFFIGTGAGYTKRATVKLRNLEFCNVYWPDRTLQNQPRFFAEYDWNHILLVPTPALAHPYEFNYYEKVEPLDSTVQTNWWTINAPQVLQACVLYEAKLYIKDYAAALLQEQVYDKAVSSQFGQGVRQKIDRSAEVKDK